MYKSGQTYAAVTKAYYNKDLFLMQMLIQVGNVQGTLSMS